MGITHKWDRGFIKLSHEKKNQSWNTKSLKVHQTIGLFIGDRIFFLQHHQHFRLFHHRHLDQRVGAGTRSDSQ